MYFTVISKKRIIKIISILLGITILFSCVIGLNVKSVFSSNTYRQLPIYYVETDEKKIAISFDCAWGTDYTDKLLEIMESEKVKCTFFMVEFWAQTNSEYVKKIAEKGHEIGTHSASHPYMSKLSKSQIISELESSKKVIESITNERVKLFRPPYGDYNDNVINTAKELGLYSIQWDVDSLDWKNISASEIENRVISKVKNGSIVLFHNQGLHTSEALLTIIRTLKGKGYTFLRISDLIYKDNYQMKTDGGQQRIKGN